MVMPCKDICVRLETRHINAAHKTDYKKCRTCSISIKTDLNICPCCKKKLSVRRIHNYKKRLVV